MRLSPSTLVAAVLIFAAGFLLADRMAVGHAATPQQARETEMNGAFSGSSGTLVTKDAQWMFVVRDTKVYKLQMSAGGENSRVRPWALLSE